MFIDADKRAYRTYYELGLQLLRRGGLMLIDNMLWSGQVANPADRSPTRSRFANSPSSSILTRAWR